MNNEPVAWVTPPENVWTSCLVCGQRVAGDSIHTCSPQLKTLTDEEINELYADYQNPDYYSREIIFDQLGFARAILRKAQEK